VRRHQDAAIRRRLSRHNDNVGHIVCSDDDDAKRRKVNQLAGAAGQERPHNNLGEFFFRFGSTVSFFLRQFPIRL
jgi:hypothetical protein